MFPSETNVENKSDSDSFDDNNNNNNDDNNNNNNDDSNKNNHSDDEDNDANLKCKYKWASHKNDCDFAE